MSDRPVRRRFPEGTTAEDLKEYMVPFVSHLGYKLNTETEFVDEVFASELEILERDGDVYCPCRIRTGDPKEDLKIVCPCIPFYLDEFDAMRKCWCGLFIKEDVEDGAELIGVIEQPESGPSEVRVASLDDLCERVPRHVKVGKNDVALFLVAGEVYALSNVCRHAFAPLSDGYVEGYEVVCPWHGWRYDVRAGTTDHPNADIRTFSVRIENGAVYLRIW